jgi:glycosyltransferase involved in cell wall biosynthesis
VSAYLTDGLVNALPPPIMNERVVRPEGSNCSSFLCIVTNVRCLRFCAAKHVRAVVILLRKSRMRKRKTTTNIMIWSASRGGMRTMVEYYVRDGFVKQHNIALICSYVDRGFVMRQFVLMWALVAFVWALITKKVSIVHCHAAMRGSFWRKSLFAIIARAFGIPTLFHLHGSEMKSFYANQSRWVQRMISRQLEQASRVIVLSDSWKAFVLSIAPRSRPIVVPNYVHIPDAPTAVRKSTITLLFLGLIGQRKGVFDLLKAFAGARARHANLRLVIGGDGQVAKAAKMARELQIADVVTFAGWVDGSAKTALLETADIYLLPSHNEGLPVSVLEAMAYRLPVITTPVGGIPELITDGVEGRLVTRGDLLALENTICELAEDSALRRRFGQAGYERVSNYYSKAVVLPLMSKIYADVISESELN